MHMERQLEKRRPVPSSLGCGRVKIPQVEGIGVLISYPCHAVYAKMATVLKQLYCWTTYSDGCSFVHPAVDAPYCIVNVAATAVVSANAPAGRT